MVILPYIYVTDLKQECLSVEDQPPACFDLNLGPVTLVLKLDLDMVLIYHCAKNKVSMLL